MLVIVSFVVFVWEVWRVGFDVISGCCWGRCCCCWDY